MPALVGGDRHGIPQDAFAGVPGVPACSLPADSVPWCRFGFRVPGTELFGVQGLRVVSGLGFCGLGFRARSSKFSVSALGVFRVVLSLGCRVWVQGFGLIKV